MNKEVKYVQTKDGKEVKLGDVIHVHRVQKAEHYTKTIDEFIEMSEDNIPYLLGHNIITAKPLYDNKSPLDDVSKLVNKVASHINGDLETAIAFLALVYKVNTTSFYNMVFKKLAVEYDKAYSDHISKADTIYFISSMDFSISAVDKKDVNFKNFAAFRTPEDAAKALKVARFITQYFNDVK